MKRALGVPVMALAAVLVMSPAAMAQARDEPLLIALSMQRIEIDSSFAGTSILLFGVTDVEGDIVVSVRGPEVPMVVRRKRRAGGLWVNRDSVAFRNVPQYYAVAASRPLEDIAPVALRAGEQLGIDHLLLEAIWIRTPEDADRFREALHRHKERDALYRSETGTVEFIDKALFRSTLTFPANVPTGDYHVEALLMRDGRVLSVRSTTLRIEKGGISADIFTFARSDEPLYGGVAIALALVAGWLGSVAFRKS